MSSEELAYFQARASAQMAMVIYAIAAFAAVSFIVLSAATAGYVAFALFFLGLLHLACAIWCGLCWLAFVKGGYARALLSSVGVGFDNPPHDEWFAELSEVTDDE